MDCHRVQLMLSALQDGHVVESERRLMEAHLAVCSGCRVRSAELEAVRRSVAALPRRTIPAHIHFRLRSMASREAARRRHRLTLRAWAYDISDRLSLAINNMMRPLAIPAAGGLVSAVVLFSMVMTNFQGIVRQPANDVPTMLATDASVKFSLVDFAEADITVNVFVDESGRVTDYAFPDSMNSAKLAPVKRQIENSLLFTEFNPATTFGKPTAGWVRVTFRRSQIDVKG
jgi:hypothetical protein